MCNSQRKKNVPNIWNPFLWTPGEMYDLDYEMEIIFLLELINYINREENKMF